MKNTLRTLRKEKNVTQKIIADKLNITISTYSQWENDLREPDVEKLEKLADYFGCSIDYIVGRESEDGIVIFSGNETSKDENHLLDILRTLPPNKKEMIYQFAEYLKEDSKR